MILALLADLRMVRCRRVRSNVTVLGQGRRNVGDGGSGGGRGYGG